MLAVNSHYWVQKCALSRFGSGVLAVLGGLKLEPQRRQSVRNCAARPGVLNFHSSAVQSKNLLMNMLEKKKKRRWYETPQPILTSQSGFLTPMKKQKKDQQESRRVRTLNIIVYKAVVDLLSSYEVNQELQSYSVEFTKVSFTADYTSCRIYWKTSWSAEKDSKIQQLLDRSAPRIRYLLMSLQILSNVPPLTFVQDKKYAALKEVESLLEIADYGPSEDEKDLCFGGKDADTRLTIKDPVEKKRALWINIDHDALYKQIEDYKLRSSVSSSEITSSPGLTEEQLSLLAEIRKQKLIEKKKRKSKKLKDDDDDDISPKAFLLARQLEQEELEKQKELEEQEEEKKELEEEQHSEHDVEDNQVSERMNDYDRKH